MKFKWLVLALPLLAAMPGWAAAQTTQTPFTPHNRPISPFGYGDVQQRLVTAAGTTGTAWCQAWLGNAFQCASVSGGNSCSTAVPAGELVSCNAAGTKPVDETAFATIDCKGQANGPIGNLGPLDWCLTAALETTRTIDTLYLYNDYVRVGMNRRFGGTVFELYGTDKRNRIMQNGGGAMQLSLWGDDLTYAPTGSQMAWFGMSSNVKKCDPTAYAAQSTCESANGGAGSCQYGLVGANDTNCSTQFSCGSNGAGPGAAINPIQAISAGCNYGKTQFSNNEAAITSPITSPSPGVIVAGKAGPQQFTKSSHTQTANLAWYETMQVTGPFVETTYKITYTGLTPWNADFQEIPALLTSQGMANGFVYYYGGSAPYTNAASQVTRVSAALNDGTTQVYQFPGRNGPFGAGVPGGYGGFLTEDWVSLCDATQTKCITVVSFAPDVQDLIYGPGDYSYFGLHGFFAMKNPTKKIIPVFVAPYRFDDVVGGKTVRQWIYSLRTPGAP